ncbi:SRPBCC family protein [Sphingomonas sp. DT-204]|uniref:SRPBCC family protein n=1 Tax=Sphingomonas sp. DT-204 TaxID=3396166 RepID=UPI003F1B3BDB
MAEATDHPADDAPLAASKRRAAAVDAATEALIEPKGDTLVGRAVTINRPLPELFAYWRDFANLATFMENVERIDVLDSRRSHWVVKAPGGKTVEWDSVVTDERDGAFVAWASEPGADVPNSGRVDFRDAGPRGTVVTATILYDPPAGAVGKLIAKVFQREPAIQARRDLRRFKQLMETGEIATGARNRRLRQEGKN